MDADDDDAPDFDLSSDDDADEPEGDGGILDI
jgi:hypothetical protein